MRKSNRSLRSLFFLLPLLCLPLWGDIDTRDGQTIGSGGVDTIDGIATSSLSKIDGQTIAGGFTYYSVNFDGGADYLTRGAALTGAADGKEGTFSVWYKANADGAGQNWLDTTSSRFFILKDTSDRINVIARNSSGTTILDSRNATSDLLEVADGWVHVLISWNLATGDVDIRMNDVSDIYTATSTNDTIDYATTPTEWVIGKNISGGYNYINGYIAEYWFDDTYFDLDTESNRRKFYGADGKPVDLGSDGSTPTGAAPLIYLRNEVPDWETNLGSGGGFTENGTLNDGGAEIP